MGGIVNSMQKNVSTSLTSIINIIDSFQHDTSGTIQIVVNECLESLRRVTRRIDYMAFQLTNSIMGIATAIVLSLLILLTYFSPFLRFIVSFMFIILCAYMVLTYIRHCQTISLPTDENREEAPIQHRNPQVEEIIAQATIQCEIDLTGRQLIDEDMMIVTTQAINNKQCKMLRLGHNTITEKGASILANVLGHNKTLEQLSLWNNNLSDMGIMSLTTTLAINRNMLRKLDLSGNGITDAGAMHIVQMLRTNRILTHLSLCRNKISNDGIRSLASTIQNRNDMLEVLSLSGNKLVTDTSVDPLQNMIRYTRSLKKLWIDDCNLSQKGQATLKTTEKSKTGCKVYT